MLNVREATPEDKEAVIKVWDDSGISQPWNEPPRDFDRAMDAPGSAVLVVEDERIEAVAIAGYDGHMGWIHMMGVRPGLQGRGVGRMLADACKDHLHNAGATDAYLLVAPDNTNGIEFWEHLGFFKIDAPVWTVPLGDKKPFDVPRG